MSKSYVAVLGSDQKNSFIDWVSNSIYAHEVKVQIDPVENAQLHMFTVLLFLPESIELELENWCDYFRPV